MKQDHHTTLSAIATTRTDVCRWVQALFICMPDLPRALLVRSRAPNPGFSASHLE